MATEQDTPQTDLEAQPEASPKGATQTPPAADNAPPEPQADDPLAVRQGETVEQYAARVRGEVSWRDKQIGRQHRQKKEADERLAKAAEIEAENTRLRELAQAGTKPRTEAAPQPQPEPQPSRQPQPATVSADAKAQARFEVGVERLSEQLNAMPEWKAVAKNLEAAGGIPPEMVSTILDTDDPAKVMIALGSDPNRFQQILDMHPNRRTAALIKLGLEIKPAEPSKDTTPRKPSNAPAPRGDLPNAGAAPPEGDLDLYDDKYRGPEHDGAWYAKRQEQKRQSQGRPWSFGGRSGAQRG